MELTELTIHELHARLRSGDISSVEATRAFLRRIEATDDNLNAFITVCPETALAGAEAADRRIAEGSADLLTGIPLALKDIFCTEGVRTTCASKILDNFVPPYDGTTVARLKERGAVLLGKLNMDEFAMGSSNTTSHYGNVVNPWRRKNGSNVDLVPGGSSGPFAGILLMHGLPGDRSNNALFARGLTATGAVVLMIDAPFARPENRHRPGWPLGHSLRINHLRDHLLVARSSVPFSYVCRRPS